MNVYDLYLGLMLAILFGLILLVIELGRRVAARRLSNDPEGPKIGIAGVEAAVFALFGLIIAFSFHGASQRLESRKQLIIEETNSITTAWSHIDLLPESSKAPLKLLFKSYTDARIKVNKHMPGTEEELDAIKDAGTQKNAIWTSVSRIYKELTHDYSSLLVIPSMSAMFDMAATRDFARRNHAPMLIFATLFFLTVICSFFVGYNLAGGKRVYWLHGTIFAAVIVLMFFVIIDFEYPRLGAISMRVYDRPLIDLRKTMD